MQMCIRDSSEPARQGIETDASGNTDHNLLREMGRQWLDSAFHLLWLDGKHDDIGGPGHIFLTSVAEDAICAL